MNSSPAENSSWSSMTTTVSGFSGETGPKGKALPVAGSSARTSATCKSAPSEPFGSPLLRRSVMSLPSHPGHRRAAGRFDQRLRHADDEAAAIPGAGFHGPAERLGQLGHDP